MDVVRDYDSDEEEQFHPCADGERDWKSTHPLLRVRVDVECDRIGFEATARGLRCCGVYWAGKLQSRIQSAESAHGRDTVCEECESGVRE